MRDRVRISELAAMLGVTNAWAWRLARERGQLRAREVGGVLTVSAADAMRLMRRREADPPNAHRGRKTYMQVMKNTISAGTAAESAAGSRAPVSRATRGIKKTAGGGALLSAEPKPAVSRRRSLAALREYDPRLIPVGR